MSRRRGQLDGFLDAGSELNGDLRFRDTFRIEGRFEGRVVSEGELHVGVDGFVEGDLEVRRLFVAGRVKGTICSSDRVIIAPGGRVEGSVSTPCLLLEEGSIFDGYCQMSAERSKDGGATVHRMRDGRNAVDSKKAGKQ